MNIRTLFIPLIFITMFGFTTMIDDLRAQSASEDPVVLEETSRVVLYSEAVDDEFVIEVALPYNYSPDSGPLPVLLITDGNMNFPVVLAARLMIEFEGVPPFAIAGIGYHSRNEAFSKRFRDFTPSNPDIPICRTELYQCGGADAFIDFITDELVPFLADTYPIDSGNITLMGHSLGGLLAAWALLKKPHFFSGYIIGSPAYLWHGGLIFGEEERFAEKNNVLSTHIYMASGGIEEHPESPFRGTEAIQQQYRMVQTLLERNYDELQITSEIIPGESHMSVIPSLIYRGIRALYQPEMFEIHAD